MATAQIEALEPDYQNVTGGLEITRRLSDKILAAFNHAYGTGESEVAAALRRALEIAEAARHTVVGDQRRITYSAVAHAELWVTFVNAREHYKSLQDRPGVGRADMDAALAAMKAAYRAWSDA